jgi:hypothetical protein
MNVDELLQQIETFLESQRQRPKPVRILDAIMGIVDRGRDHLKIWESIGTLVREDPSLVDLAALFFILSGVAHLEAATLHAAKLVEARRDSINITYLFNEIEAARSQEFLRPTFSVVSAVVSVAKIRLTSLQETVLRIRDKRDRDLAHLDRSHINTTREQQAVEAQDLHDVFNAIETVAHELASANAAFGEVTRPSLAESNEHFGPLEPKDLIYFARAAFQDQSVPSPNPRAEKLRKLDRSMRHVKESMVPREES